MGMIDRFHCLASSPQGLGSIARLLRETKSEYHMYSSRDRNTISPTHKACTPNTNTHTHTHTHTCTRTAVWAVTLSRPGFEVWTSRFFRAVKWMQTPRSSGSVIHGTERGCHITCHILYLDLLTWFEVTSHGSRMGPAREVRLRL